MNRLQPPGSAILRGLGGRRVEGLPRRLGQPSPRGSSPAPGAFDYLLDGNAIHAEPPPPIHREPPRPGRVHVQIEIIDSRTHQRRRDRRNAFWWVLAAVLFALMIAANQGHSEERWQDTRVGSTVYWNNLTTGVRGQERPMPDGSVRSEWQDPSGHVTHCVTQRFGPTLSRTCQ